MFMWFLENSYTIFLLPIPDFFVFTVEPADVNYTAVGAAVTTM